MRPAKRALITGISGFIGSRLKEVLSADGFEVWGISRQTIPEARVIRGDLTFRESTAEAFAQIPECPVVVHAAAVAHASERSFGRNDVQVNSRMTENLVRQLRKDPPRLVFVSSVAVYGLDGRASPVSVGDETRPASHYGVSKLKCEEIIQRSGIKDYYILRPTPVFDDQHMADVKKRVYFPKQNLIKMIIRPSPRYSLCHIDTLTGAIVRLVEGDSPSERVANVAEPVPYDQNQLAGTFRGLGVPIPRFVATAMISLLAARGVNCGYGARCALGKVFRDNVYS